jgi:tetratricopeptide (TPR) repeat protein
LPNLRISQHPAGVANRFQIEVNATDIPNFGAQSFSAEIEFVLAPAESERIRWYLEDYLQFDEEPAPTIAAGIEEFMSERGAALFRSIFEASESARQLWAMVAPRLPETRIEIVTGIAEATAIPWELIRNPHTRTWLALSAQAFVRAQRDAPPVLAPQATADKVRILLVICRPQREQDVPFRSVAAGLVKRLNADARDAFDLDVLRPPTFEQFDRVLRRAREDGKPYHIVHFDGHGVYADPENLTDAGKVLSSLTLKAEPSGPRGFLMFEDPDSASNGEFVDGFRIGALLRDAAVPLLILNACQSAFAEAPAKPDEGASAETRDEIEAYGSLAQAVMEAGASGVVAMRYSVYVVTAAQFVAELYSALARGCALGEAASTARQNLAAQPDRKVAFEPRPLQDWCVPVVWERAPLRLWPEQAGGSLFKPSDGGGAATVLLDPKLPQRPDLGFFGRDETLYALDRAFDTNSIVLLQAYAGSGKTATAAEFARWYAQTGGVDGAEVLQAAVLFSSFERHLPLARVLDKIGEMFGPILDQSGIQWDAIIDPSQRREVALQLLAQIPVLWIWDNVEPVAGFPSGSLSEWSADEQRELRDFLSAARDTKVKFLLTSRRSEQAWLGELPRRVLVPPMPMQERLQLAGALVSQRGRRIAELPDLTELLRFTQGNPLTILVTIGEALRTEIKSSDQLTSFVSALRRGAKIFTDDTEQGRSSSLSASLSYGFEAAFSDDERKVLSLLHLFQGFINVDALRYMGEPKADWCLDVARGLTRERGVELLDRAAEVGLLTSYGAGYYSIHPALPWFFHEHFDRSFSAREASRRAFAEAMAVLGNFYHDEYAVGRRNVLPLLAAEEDNLIAALRLARAHGWWHNIVLVMQGMSLLYSRTGRGPAWRQLVETIVPDFVDQVTDDALPGRERQWGTVTIYRIHLAREARDWTEAERLLRKRILHARKDVDAALAAADMNNSEQRFIVRNLAAILHELGEVQRKNGDVASVESFREAFDIAGQIGDSAGQASCALNLGSVYQDVAGLRDLPEAEFWYKQGLDLAGVDDMLLRAKNLAQLGSVAYEKYVEARSARQPIEALLGHLNEAEAKCHDALRIYPETDIIGRGQVHYLLGNIYSSSGDIERALLHYRHDIRHCEQAGDIYGAGQTRFNTAVALMNFDRLIDAQTYAQAALENFQLFGLRAVDQSQRADALVADIKERLMKRNIDQ